MGEYSWHVMEAAILLVLSNLFIFSNSGPDPEINLHVHLPPEEVPHVPDIGGAKVKNTTKGVKTSKGDNDTEEALEVHHPDTEAASGPTEAPKGITSPPMKSKVVKEEKDKKTNDTISFEMEGEMDDQPYVSCGSHYEHTCEDCISSTNRPSATSPRLWCNGDCIWRNRQCTRKSNKKQVNCGGHSADSCADCPKAGGGDRNWCNGDCKVDCRAKTSCRSTPREWACVKKAAPCKEPKPVVTCDYFCYIRTCYVRWRKEIPGRYLSYGTHPHWNKTVPIECKDKCLKQVPGCEFRLKL